MFDQLKSERVFCNQVHEKFCLLKNLMIGKLNYNLLQKIHDKGSNPVLNTKEKENNGWIHISSIVYLGLYT